MLKQISEKLIIKAYEAIFMKEKEGLSNKIRTMTEKINFMEQDQ